MKAYVLFEKEIKREGNKIEYHYGFNENGNNAEIVEKIEDVIKRKDILTKGFLNEMNREAKVNAFESIRKELGLRAGKKQEDVYEFIEILLKGFTK